MCFPWKGYEKKRKLLGHRLGADCAEDRQDDMFRNDELALEKCCMYEKGVTISCREATGHPSNYYSRWMR